MHKIKGILVISNAYRAIFFLGAATALFAANGPIAFADGEPTKVDIVASQLPETVQEAGVLRIAVPDTGRPLAYKDGAALKGLDPDLAKAVAGVLGLKAEIQLIPFAAALPGLQSDKYDVSYGQFYVTAARLKVADFVTDWRDYSSFLVMKTKDFKPSAVTAICGHIVGAMAGSAELAILNSESAKCGDKKATVSAFPSISNAILALDSSRVDAVLINRGGAQGAINLDQAFQASGEIGGGPTAVAVARNANSEKMLGAIQAAYDHLIESGDYAKILKHYDSTYGAITKAEIFTKDSPPPKYSF